jgi:tripartite-type tricarboxylate transporter receptor subunit TctC
MIRTRRSVPDAPPRGRRAWVAGAAALAAAGALGSAARAQGRWPERPIRLIVPFPPGGNSDNLARIVADRLRELLPGTVLIDNRPGGSTQVGTDAVARAEPDGHTMLLLTATAVTVLPHLRKLPFSVDSFEIAGGVAEYIAIVTVRNGLGVKTLAEFVALAKRQPGKLTWGSAGNASVGHIYGEILKKQAGIDLLHVPFKGSADSATALQGDQIDMIIDGVGLGLARNGRAVALATFYDQRHPELPNVPSLPETGLNVKAPMGGWAIAFPRGTPAPIVARTSAALERLLAEPETAEKLLRASVVSAWRTPAAYRAGLEEANSFYRDLLQSIGMKEGS